ncbi:MAG: hypothetical protein COS97_00040 [Candidatus Nealsonbacteria bacterium CG07_land_8_20_14_0_80_40_10]|nr:MAG: hypothetical protein COS97_00040 [Candidatus Nealsonbacteria bacterium CG07_land_8_20_14_0_80_40_10]
MALKDWKQINYYEPGNSIADTWMINPEDNNSSLVDVRLYSKEPDMKGIFRVAIYPEKGKVSEQTFSSRAKALSFAKSYMRRH